MFKAKRGAEAGWDGRYFSGADTFTSTESSFGPDHVKTRYPDFHLSMSPFVGTGLPHGVAFNGSRPLLATAPNDRNQEPCGSPANNIAFDTARLGPEMG